MKTRLTFQIDTSQYDLDSRKIMRQAFRPADYLCRHQCRCTQCKLNRIRFLFSADKSETIRQRLQVLD
jgi:hypothetical protein